MSVGRSDGRAGNFTASSVRIALSGRRAADCFSLKFDVYLLPLPSVALLLLQRKSDLAHRLRERGRGAKIVGLEAARHRCRWSMTSTHRQPSIEPPSLPLQKRATQIHTGELRPPHFFVHSSCCLVRLPCKFASLVGADFSLSQSRLDRASSLPPPSRNRCLSPGHSYSLLRPSDRAYVACGRHDATSPQLLFFLSPPLSQNVQ